MADADRFTAVAEAVADGVPIEWASFASAADTADVRDTLDAFRALASVGELFATLARGARAGARPDMLPPGTVWGGLRIVEHIGQGRYGDVYRAWDPALDRYVALKLTCGRDRGEGLDAHVVEEGRLMARVRHPGVVTIHGAQRIAGVTGLWMELVEGRTLEEELADVGPFSASALEAVGIELCEALAAVHGAGLVHRDVKASNVLRDPSGRVVLGDFGTGREQQDEAAARQGLVGTPAYLAPEIFAREAATARSDVYSLGVLLFHLATGAYPHAARSLSELRAAHAGGTGRALQDLRPDLPARLVSIVNRALDADPARRFPSGSEMAAAFRTHLEGRGRRRQTVLWTAVGAAAAVLAAVAWMASHRASGPSNAGQPGLILVTAFDNRTGLPELDDALEGAIRSGLQASGVARTVPASRVAETLALMRLPPDTRVDARIGREIALRDSGIHAVLAGRVERMGASYRLTTDVLSPADGATVASTIQMAKGRDALPDAIRLAATRVAERLRSAAPKLTSAPQLQRVSTRSLAALQAYERALRSLPRFADPYEAERLLREALRLDQDFAMAYVALAHALYNQGGAMQRKAAVLEAAALAVSKSGLATLEEQSQARGDHEFFLGRLSDNPAQRQRHFERVADIAFAINRSHPGNVWAVSRLLDLPGPFHRGRTLVLARALVDQRPESLDAVSRAAYVAANEREFDHAGDYLARGRTLLDRPYQEAEYTGRVFDFLVLLFEDAWNRNDIDAATAVLEEIDAARGRVPAELAASTVAEATLRVYITLGQFTRAEALASGITHDPNMRRLRMLSVLIRQGDRERLRAFMNRDHLDLTIPGGWAFIPGYIAAGYLDEARPAIERLRPNQTWQWMAGLDSNLAFAEGRPDRAIEVLKPFVALDPRGDDVEIYGAWLGANRALGQAWHDLGNVAEALRVLERASAIPRELRRPGINGGFEWLRLRDLLARCYRSVGRTADAAAIEAELRVLLRYADEDHPIGRRLTVVE